jgi:hypothetical protein
MSSAITCAKSELAGFLDRESSPSSVLPCRRCPRHFFMAEIWSDSLPYTIVSSISISLALRPLTVEKRTTARCFIWHFLPVRLPKLKGHIMARRGDCYP